MELKNNKTSQGQPLRKLISRRKDFLHVLKIFPGENEAYECSLCAKVYAQDF